VPATETPERAVDLEPIPEGLGRREVQHRFGEKGAGERPPIRRGPSGAGGRAARKHFFDPHQVESEHDRFEAIETSRRERLFQIVKKLVLDATPVGR
jgi:hypothetical protein